MVFDDVITEDHFFKTCILGRIIAISSLNKSQRSFCPLKNVFGCLGFMMRL